MARTAHTDPLTRVNIIARSYVSLIESTPRESALAAYTRGGPSVDELERRIVEWQQRNRCGPARTNH